MSIKSYYRKYIAESMDEITALAETFNLTRRNPLPLGGDEYEKIVANRPKL